MPPPHPGGGICVFGDGTIPMIRKPFRTPRTFPGRPLWWAAAAAVAALAVVLSLVLSGNAGSGAGAKAGHVLGSVAAAQAAAREQTGAYASLWLKGNDRTLGERGKDIPAEGAEDVRSIQCGSGWLAGVRVDGQVFLRSSAADAVRQDPEAVQLPACISSEARDALLADLGVERTWPPADAAQLQAPA